MSAEEKCGGSETAVVFDHPLYELNDEGRAVRKADAPPPSEETKMTEEGELLDSLVAHVRASMVALGFEEHFIPSDDAEAKCSVMMTSNWDQCSKLLIVTQNASGSQMGIWSRTLCMDVGLRTGSMLPVLERALAEEYGVVVLNPNANSVFVSDDAGHRRKITIENSGSPEEHTLFVWDSILTNSTAAQVDILAYGNGASLAKDIYMRELAEKTQGKDESRIHAIATIEASHLQEEDDADDVKGFLRSRCVNWERTENAAGFRLPERNGKLGCMCLSVGPVGDGENVAFSIGAAIDPVFRFLTWTNSPANTDTLRFAEDEARQFGLDPATAEVVPPATPAAATPSPPAARKEPFGGIFHRLFDRNRDKPAAEAAGAKPAAASASSSASAASIEEQSHQMSVTDFDLIKVVGKGAFGKVMLVRKKTGADTGQIYAMKVLKKSMIAAKGQVEHTKSERSILCEIRHPFVVCLRFAFQSPEKLYLVTDYYNGGSLFYHLRKSRHFSERRARFYAAELCSALGHLHTQHVVYRDLKLENVLMDGQGHIALTDFGLSKQNVSTPDGAATFCGTAEYIAPELLKGQHYGFAVDWWSFGILLYEMMAGRTPFYDKNRKLMFYNIINSEPHFPSSFSANAVSMLRGLLRIDPTRRMGSSPEMAQEIVQHPFFSVIDWEAILRKDLTPPFAPDVQNVTDTRYVPKTYLQAEAKDSVVEAKPADEVPQFSGFTFVPKSKLSQANDADNDT